MTRASRIFRHRAAALLVVLLGTTGACSLTLDAHSLGARTTLSAEPDRQPTGERFKVTRKAVYVLWGLAAASQPSLEQVLAGQITGEQGVANLRVRVHSNVGDLIATLLTAGLIVPRSVTFEGIIVQPPAAAPPP